MSEIECPRCHRISFAGETEVSCRECHWMIRPPAVEKPYGYDVLIVVMRQSLRDDTEARHYKGTEATVRRRAKLVPGFVRVAACVPLSEAAWLRCYGRGRA